MGVADIGGQTMSRTFTARKKDTSSVFVMKNIDKQHTIITSHKVRLHTFLT